MINGRIIIPLFLGFNALIACDMTSTSKIAKYKAILPPYPLTLVNCENKTAYASILK